MGLLQARLLEDCATNLRIAYELGVPVDEALFASAGADQIVVHEFTRHVRGARDHLVATFALDPPVRVEGVAGAPTVTVTFGSLHGAARPEAVAIIEQRLSLACQEAATSSV